jgi:hypothetical protein
MKYERVFVEPGLAFDFPIVEGNTFANFMMQVRMQGFLIDGTINAYVPITSIRYVLQIENIDGTTGMTKQ